MPVSRRIAAQVQQIQQAAAAEVETQPQRRGVKRKSSPHDAVVKQEPPPSPAPSRAAAASAPPPNPAVQLLSLDGVEVKPDTSLAGVVSARTRRRRESAKAAKQQKQQQQKTQQAKRRKVTADDAGSPSAAASSSAASSSSPPSASAADLLALHTYSHPPAASELQRIHNKRERRAISNRVSRDALLSSAAAASRILEPAAASHLSTADPLMPTWKLSQRLLAASVDDRTRSMHWSLELDRGPYALDWSRNGRYALLGGRRGHVAVMEWKDKRLLCELDVNVGAAGVEEVRDVQFLHSHEMFAVAQRHAVYLYDSSGLELHRLTAHSDPLALDFLPYHFLLTSVSSSGHLKYTDTSTGTLVAQHRTRLPPPPCASLCHNAVNGVAVVGHGNGVVTMWSPTVKEALVQMLVHKGGVTAVAVDGDGRYLVTAGMESEFKVWDVRTYRQLHAYFTVRPPSALAVSQTGMVALGYGSHVAVWRDVLQPSVKQPAPYLSHSLPSLSVSSLAFCPYEDILGVGSSGGFSTLIAPASGFSAFDSSEADPFESKAARRERTVVALLEKLQPEMISLQAGGAAAAAGGSGMVAMMDAGSKEIWEGERRDARRRQQEEESLSRAAKEKQRGGQKSSKRWRRKRAVSIVDEQTVKRQQEQQERKQRQERQQASKAQQLPIALQRFVKKR